MQVRINTALLAALIVSAAPVISHASEPVALALSASAKASPADASKTFAKQAMSEEAFRETDVWGRIRSGYAIPDVNNNLVGKHAKWYSDRPDYMARTSARASSGFKVNMRGACRR